MWPHSSVARSWASAIVRKDPGVMTWCLSEPWRELRRLGYQPLHSPPSFSPPTRNSRDCRHSRRGNIDDWTQNLETSSKVEMFRPSGATGLIPPSHFQARPISTLPRMAPTWVPDISLTSSPTQQDASKGLPDNHRPPVVMWGQEVSGSGQELGWRGRSVELTGTQALSQQAELISHQLGELRRLEEELRTLRETSLQQKMRLESQALELEALARAEKAGRAEAEGLRAALAGAELVRKNLEEGSQRELEEVQRLHQEQLSSLSQAHQQALSSLTNKAAELEKSLNILETRRAGETKELTVAQKEAQLLQTQLSKTQEDLKAQVTLVENLRRYVGEQVPPEVHNQKWEPERQELLETVQHLEEERDGLRTTTELLQVRVDSLMQILSIQEEELARKVQPSDGPEPDFTKKCQSLLKGWREKVFVLMVQLKAQDLEQRALVEKLKEQVSELQERATTQNQEQAILEQSLQDRTAEVEVERMGAKALQMELNRVQEARRRRQQQTTETEEQLKLVVNAVTSFQTWLQGTMTEMEQAAARLPGLSNRVSYAVRKIHTIQSLMARKLALVQLRQEREQQSCSAPPSDTDMSLELEQLREERNRLDAELQLSAHIIQQEVGRAREQGEAERLQLSEVAQQLEQELQRTQESLASVGLQLEAARQGQQESTEEAANLRQELDQQQELYGQALQEKVAEVETRLREQLAESERRLNEARQEHAKAVISMHQMQRKAIREKERNQELRRLHDEARKEEGQRLTQRVRELEKDKNIMLATLQQEGLLSRYKQQRLLAVLPTLLAEEAPVESSHKPPVSPVPVRPEAILLTRESIKGSLSVLLDDLQGLSEAISKEEAISQGDNQNSPAPIYR